MQRLDLQFYAFFMVVLCGAVLGLLFDFLRVVVRRGRLGVLWSGVADLLFWVVATVALSGALFYGNWGELRLYVLVGILIGLGLYKWLASPVVSGLFDLLLSLLAWLVRALQWLITRLIWLPILTLVHFLINVLAATGRLSWRALCWIGRLLLQPLIGPFRWLKLQYLLAKRRWRRRFRRRR